MVLGKYLQNSHCGLGYLKSINNNWKETKMKTLTNSRQFHKALAPWVFLPLFISSISPATSRSVFPALIFESPANSAL